MRVKVSLIVDNCTVKDDLLQLDDDKLEELTKDEVGRVIEIKVRDWADRMVRIEWETE